MMLDKHGKPYSQAALRDMERRGAFEDEMSESDEDFEFMETKLQGRPELDEMERNLLIGIIQPPPIAKKRYDKMSREEVRRLKLGDEYSDEYDDEVDEFDMERDGTALGDFGKSAKGRNKVGVASDEPTEEISIENALLPCPEGFDPIKWGIMTLKEKLAYLKISQSAWNKMYREEHLKRLNKHAEGFHFYALDKKMGKDEAEILGIQRKS